MTILSNVEFEKLVTDQSPRLRTIAKQRCDQAPTGVLTRADIDQYIQACTYSGDKKAAQWLKSLIVVSKNGKLARLRSNEATWEDHVEEVHRLSAAKEALDIGQHVRCKESGRYGSIADYNPDSKEYIVVLDPFQIMVYKSNQIETVASHKINAQRSKQAGFMQPMVEEGTWITIDGPQGGESIPADYVGSEDIEKLKNEIEVNGTASLEGTSLRDFCENSEIYSIEVETGYSAYLSAPGYMDRTENTVFDTEEEAWAHLKEMYPEEFEN